ncbi:MAG: ComEC/Rec2 family competence protein, partial [Acidimicrobiia bacterium]|nr:ComEC/Rec2 family competence protein [Acidimicrobiia bacterium]
MAAAAAWIGCWAGWWGGIPAPAGVLVLAAAAAVVGKRPAALVLAVAAAAALSGWLAAGRVAAARETALPRGPVTLAADVGTDPIHQWGALVVAVRPTHLHEGGEWREWSGPRLRLEVDDGSLVAGDRILVIGSILAAPGWLRGDPVAGSLVPRSITRLGGPGDPLFSAGNLIRARVEVGIAPFRPRPAAALLSGFLIGDVRDLPEAESDALRRTGLTHFVAVSGSNVALFLAAWWVAMGPLGWSPRLRAAAGMAGL